MEDYGTKRKFEVVIVTDPYDEHEPSEKDLREFIQLCLSPRKYQLSDRFTNFTVKAKRTV
jgi:hypothetical protein